MTKQELVSKIAETTGLTKKDATAAYEAAIKAIKEALISEGSVMINGLGTFKVVTRKPRVVRNIKTGEEMTIPERKTTTFRPCKELRVLD